MFFLTSGFLLADGLKVIYEKEYGEGFVIVNSVSFVDEDGKVIKYVPKASSEEKLKVLLYDSVVSPESEFIVLPIARKDGFQFSRGSEIIKNLRGGSFDSFKFVAAANSVQMFHHFVKWVSSDVIQIRVTKESSVILVNVNLKKRSFKVVKSEYPIELKAVFSK